MDISPVGFVSIRGSWSLVDDIAVSGITKRDIYRSALEPSFVSWAILWKGADGALKLSFVEATGDVAAWPPTYDFTSAGIEWYLKTLVSRDGGNTWDDTGRREELDRLWDRNSHPRIYDVIQLRDGSLIRIYCHTIEGVLMDAYKYRQALEYDPSAGQEFPFSFSRKGHSHLEMLSFWKSADGGESWLEICPPDPTSTFFATSVHQLRNGSIVATGALRVVRTDNDTYRMAVSESWDGGVTWSKPQALWESDDALVSQGITEENDFAELEDGRLLMIVRTGGAGMHTLQTYLSRDGSGVWSADAPTANPDFVQTGNPYVLRTSDGVIFYYCHSAIRYTCDDGVTWHSLPTGFSYYGQMAEVAPGKIVAITQNNIGDCCYPWKLDSSILQLSFEYERIKRVEQTDASLTGCVAALGENSGQGFHVHAEVRADGECGVAFSITDHGYGFAAIVIPRNESRAPGKAARTEQDASLVIGKCENGIIQALRTIFIGKAVVGSWIEMQVQMREGVLKAAVKLGEGDMTTGGPCITYAAVRDDFGGPGRLGFFTNKSTGGFKNIKLLPAGFGIRDNWRSS